MPTFSSEEYSGFSAALMQALDFFKRIFNGFFSVVSSSPMLYFALFTVAFGFCCFVVLDFFENNASIGSLRFKSAQSFSPRIFYHFDIVKAIQRRVFSAKKWETVIIDGRKYYRKKKFGKTRMNGPAQKKGSKSKKGGNQSKIIPNYRMPPRPKNAANIDVEYDE